MPTQAGSTNKLNPIKGFAKFIPVTEEELNGTLGTFVFGAKMGLIFPDGSLRITDGQTALKDLPAVNITPELLQTALSVQYNHPIKVAPLSLTALIALQNQSDLTDQDLIADSDKISMTAGFGVPTGTVLPFAGAEIPAGFLLCNGAAVSKTTYSELFKVIGSVYGDSGNADTFLLPDLRDRYICGVGTNSLGTYLAEQLPNITGKHNPTYKYALGETCFTYLDGDTGGAFYRGQEWTGFTHQTYSNNTFSLHIGGFFNAAFSNSKYNGTSVRPLSLVFNAIIKN